MSPTRRAAGFSIAFGLLAALVVTSRALAAPGTITVAPGGTGAGRVTSNPPGIDCPGDCQESYAPGTPVTLTATAAAGSTFDGWSGGGCSGTRSCRVVAGAAASVVTATFDAQPLALDVVNAGGGSVTADVGGIDCGNDCVASLAYGTRVTLHADADPGLVFVGWATDVCDAAGAACAGCAAAVSCSFSMVEPASVRAVFRDPARSAGAFALATPAIAFGKVARGASKPQTLVITDIGGTGTLASLSIDGTGDFAVQGGSCLPVPRTLFNDDACGIVVAFAPASIGAQHATLRIGNDGIPHPLLIALTGTGIDAPVTGGKVVVKEFFNAPLGHYFLTANPLEQAALGAPPFADWQPTGRAFNAYDATKSPPAASAPVCRFFNDHFGATSTHFYALPDACGQVLARFPDWTLEDPQVFYMLVPSADGTCADGADPVFRLYNNGMGGAPNHRFVTSLDDRAAMIARGYTPEGAGALGVAMCAPQ